MVKDGVQLVVDGPEVRGRVRLAIGVLVVDEQVLPANDVDGLDLRHPHLPEERDDLVLDHVFLGQPGVLPDSGLNLGGIYVDEVGKGHVHGPVMDSKEVLLPHERFKLGGKAPLDLVPLSAPAVSVEALGVERPVLASIYGHLHHRQRILLRNGRSGRGP